MGTHIVDGEFQSDKYPTTPRGKVPLSVKDRTAQDLLWQYAQRRRSVDAGFADDLEAALRAKGYEPPAAKPSALDDKWSAVISARYVVALSAILADQDPYYTGVQGLQIEPCSAGGVLLVATTGRTLAVIHDVDGRAKVPRRVVLPNAVIDACRPPRLPALYSEGEEIDRTALDVPDWMIPGTVLLWSIACMVFPKGKDAPGILCDRFSEEGPVWRTGHDYRLYPPNELINWRKTVPKSAATSLAAPLWLNPKYLQQFAAMAGTLDEDAIYRGLKLWIGDPDGPIVVRAQYMPEFFGLVMPIKSAAMEAVDAFPDWLAPVSPTEQPATPSADA
jgi:hypothetical protein